MFSPYPSQQPGPYGQYAQGQLVLNLSKPPGSFGISPKVKFDGYPAPASWDRNVYPMASGRHQVQVAVSYLWDYGQATSLVDVGPGQSVELFYSAPMINLVAGRIGFEPQRRPGMVGFWLVIGLAGLIVLAVVLVFIAAALSG